MSSGGKKMWCLVMRSLKQTPSLAGISKGLAGALRSKSLGQLKNGSAK